MFKKKLIYSHIQSYLSCIIVSRDFLASNTGAGKTIALPKCKLQTMPRKQPEE
jgi:hypothetical protein